MKIKDKIVIIVCSICMVFITCFGVSYKVAHKTYADSIPTTKQELGMWFASILASVGARVYITASQGYEWLVDNFEQAMTLAENLMTVSAIVQDAQDSFDQQTNTITLSEDSSEAISLYLETLQNDGLTSTSTDIDIGQYEVFTDGTYVMTENNVVYTLFEKSSGSSVYGVKNGHDVRLVLLRSYQETSRYKYIRLTYYYVSLNPFTYKFDTTNNITPTANATTYVYNGVTYYVGLRTDGWNITTDPVSLILTNGIELDLSEDSSDTAIYYAFGGGASIGDVQEVAVSADGTLSLPDMVNTADRNKEVEVDYTDMLGEEAGTKTLEEILELVQEMIASGDTELIDAIPQAEVIIKTPLVVPEDVVIPLLFDGLPEIVSPECHSLGSCLISGVQNVSQHLQSIYDSNSAVANYTMVALSIGFALYVLTGGI